MSKFNSTLKSKPNSINLAGGESYLKSAKLQIAALLLTNFGSDSFYEKEGDFVSRLNRLWQDLEDKDYMAKAALYARNTFGMRSITHYTAAIIANSLKKGDQHSWARRFFEKVIARPDDMAEILACYWKDGRKPIPCAMKYGFRKAFDKFDDYQIAKYRMNNKAITLLDVARLVHPVPTEKNKNSLKELASKTLKAADTFNAKLSEASRTAKTEEEKAENKKEVWKSFVAKGERVEYFALLRNLRNIITQADDATIKAAYKLLTNENLIKKSKVMPFRYLVAYEELQNNEDAKCALSDAMDISLANVPYFEGRTLVALDMSGSMFTSWCLTKNFEAKNAFSKGSIFAAALYKTANTDLCLFNTDARFYKASNKRDSIASIIQGLHTSAVGGGTSYASVFHLISSYKEVYDRIILISDEQSWVYNTKEAYSHYKKVTGCNPKIFTIDMAGHAYLQFPEQNCYELAGFSDKIFDLMHQLETDPKAMIHAVESVEL